MKATSVRPALSSEAFSGEQILTPNEAKELLQRATSPQDHMRLAAYYWDEALQDEFMARYAGNAELARSARRSAKAGRWKATRHEQAARNLARSFAGSERPAA